MKIAVHAADLDHGRIDGTRVYIKSLLNQFGTLAPEENFVLYHKTVFNPELTPEIFKNYALKALGKFPVWTQTRLAWELFRDKPDVLWMPLHNLPRLRRKNLKTVVTIHDLAFKFFPDYFTRKDWCKLNLLANYAIKKADKIIAISEATKNDILSLYPKISPAKITVVHHGFDAELFQKNIPQEETEKVLTDYGLQVAKYLLYVGALQPRKNLGVLIAAFEKLWAEDKNLKLVLAGERAWLWKSIIERAEKSPARENIVLPGRISFIEKAILFQNAAAFVFPSLYEGFGIPILEAFAAGTPVVAANNSSLPEVGGEAALYFAAESSEELAGCLQNVLHDEKLRAQLVAKGKKRLQNFSWEKCARETLEVIRS